MTPTSELRTKLRKLTDERIPSGGTEADTRFSDEDLDEVLEESDTVNKAASSIWEQKAIMAYSETGGMTEHSIGSETTKFINLKDYKQHCLDMAILYKDKDATSAVGVGSRVFEYNMG